MSQQWISCVSTTSLTSLAWVKVSLLRGVCGESMVPPSMVHRFPRFAGKAGKNAISHSTNSVGRRVEMDKFLMLLSTLNYLEQHVRFFSVLLLVMPFESLILCRLCLGVFSRSGMMWWKSAIDPRSRAHLILPPSVFASKSNVARQRHLAELYSNQSCD